MAHPFSAVPLGFAVMGASTLWWGGCAWDSFAIPHVVDLEPDVLVATRCPGCDSPHAWVIDRDRPPLGEQVGELLDALRQAGARLAVCTNKFEGLSKSLLGQLGLEARFGAVAGRDTFAVCKPDPGHLTGAIAMVGGSIGRAVMVGDSEVDVATAVAARVPCIGVSFGYTPRHISELGADAVIDHYREFLPALVRVLRRH